MVFEHVEAFKFTLASEFEPHVPALASASCFRTWDGVSSMFRPEAGRKWKFDHRPIVALG